MIKKISTLYLVLCFIMGGLPSLMAQNANNKPPKKELLMAEDDLVKALAKIANAVQAMEDEKDQDDIIALNLLINSYLNSSTNNVNRSDVPGYIDRRFDNIEFLLKNLTMVVSQSNNGKNIVFDRNNQTAATLAAPEITRYDNVIEGLQKQINLMQEQINTIVKAMSDSTINTNLVNVTSEIDLLKSELYKQNDILRLQADSLQMKSETSKLFLNRKDMKQVFFDFDSFKLSHEAKKVLDKVSAEMHEEKSAIATLLGLSSPEGNANYNKRLAQKRGQAVCDYLVSKGIEKNRIQISTSSIDLDSDVRSYGRRVEIYINNSK